MSDTTVLSDVSTNPLISSRLLGTSLSSSSPSKRTNSLISKVCKEAQTLFITRRLKESFTTLEPLIIPAQASDSNHEDEQPTQKAPIAGASRSTRIKVWTLYLTILDAVIDLGPEEGKNSFGSKNWRNLTAKVQEGTIWEDVVQIGYEGVEGHVDADVAIKLATLLLAHSPSQTLNQQRLESFLSDSNYPKFDVSDRFESSTENSIEVQRPVRNGNGTDNPRDLNTRIRLLEIYTLHVLPRNEEWQYAKDFIGMSEALDDERREMFLLTLDGLQAERNTDDSYGAVVVKERDKELERERQQIEQEKLEARRSSEQSPSSQYESKAQTTLNSETDYGIEQPTAIKATAKPQPKPTLKPPSPNRTRLSPIPRPSSTPKKSSTAGVYKRSLALLAALQHTILNLGQSLSKNPMILLRMVLFLVGLIVAFSRRDVRERISRITGTGWKKVKGTVGMGVKVSYI